MKNRDLLLVLPGTQKERGVRIGCSQAARLCRYGNNSYVAISIKAGEYKCSNVEFAERVPRAADEIWVHFLAE